MAAPIETLKEKIAHIRQELDEVDAVLDEIAAAQPAAKPNPLAGIKFADKEPLRKAFAELVKQMGIENMKPIGAEALQEMMLKEGVKPEDNILSRGIIEMREE